MNSAQFKSQLMTLAELTNKEFTSDAVPRYWWQTYGDLPDDVLQKAFAAAQRASRFFPTPAEFDAILRQIAAKGGAVVDGASAWDAMERELFGCWSETNDRINVRVHGYPWPNDRSKAILRGELNCTVRDVAEMHPKGVADLRARFIALYDGAAQVAQAEQTVARLAAPETVPIPIPPRPQRPRLVSGDEQ